MDSFKGVLVDRASSEIGLSLGLLFQSDHYLMCGLKLWKSSVISLSSHRYLNCKSNHYWLCVRQCNKFMSFRYKISGPISVECSIVVSF